MNTFMHSSSIAWFEDSLYLAFYICEKEGWSQRVVILKKEDDQWTFCRMFEPGTGNPVLFVWKDELYIALTKFRPETEELVNVHILWAHVDYHIYAVSFGTSGSPPHAVYPYAAGRIAPLQCDSRLLLPCYDEGLGTSLILFIDNSFISSGNLRRHSLIKSGIRNIQPTLFSNTEGKLCLLTRDFAVGFNGKAKGEVGFGIYSKEERIWRFGGSGIPNYNDSILAIPRDGELPVLVYNQSQSRTNLVLVNMCEQKEIMILTDEKYPYGSYPNYCYLPEEELAICYTVYSDRFGREKSIKISYFNSKIEWQRQEVIDAELVNSLT